MSGQQVAMVTVGCCVIIAAIGVITTSRGLARSIYEGSWGRLGAPFRPRLARIGMVGAGAIGVLIGGTVIVLALTVAAS
jgi:hypothetical protein